MPNFKSYYKKELAIIHDKYFKNLSEEAAKLIIELLPNKEHSKKVLDLGCGSGILAKKLVSKGYSVTGVDFSQEMLKIAKENVPSAKFIKSSLFDYKITSCDIVTMIGEVICYLFDNKSDLDSLKTLFQNIYDNLAPNGLLIFDFLEANMKISEELKNRIIEKKDYSMFIKLEIEPNSKILTRDITLFKKEKNIYTRNKEVHKQRLFDIKTLSNIIEKIGFKVTQIDCYKQTKFREGHVAFICQKL